MYVKYSFFTLVFFNLSVLTACEKPILVLPISSHPSLDIELSDSKKRIIEARKIKNAYSDAHFLTLDDGSDIQHIEFVESDGIRIANTYTLYLKYKDKKNGVVSKSQVLNLSSEQLKKIRNAYQFYSVE